MMAWWAGVPRDRWGDTVLARQAEIARSKFGRLLGTGIGNVTDAEIAAVKQERKRTRLAVTKNGRGRI